MGRHAVIVTGPAGSGKSTFCDAFQHHANKILRRSVHVINMDPAFDMDMELPYECSSDVRSVYHCSDIQREQNLGPNGALVSCMEGLISMHSAEWIEREFDGQYEEDYILCDFPGQLEILSHIPVLPTLVNWLQKRGYHTAVLFLLDAHTATQDVQKYLSASLVALSAMIAVDAPFLPLFTKADLLSTTEQAQLEQYIDGVDEGLLTHWKGSDACLRMLRRVCGILSDFNLVQFTPCSVHDPDQFAHVCYLTDLVVQYGEDADIHDHVDLEEENDPTEG